MEDVPQERPQETPPVTNPTNRQLADQAEVERVVGAPDAHLEDAITSGPATTSPPVKLSEKDHGAGKDIVDRLTGKDPHWD